MERRGGRAVSLLDREVLTADGCWEEEVQFKSRAPGKLDHIPVEDLTSKNIEVPQIGLDGWKQKKTQIWVDREWVADVGGIDGYWSKHIVLNFQRTNTVTKRKHIQKLTWF